MKIQQGESLISVRECCGVLFRKPGTAGADTCSEDVEHSECAIPVNAGICDTYAVLHIRAALLVTGEEIALNHDSADVLTACCKLLGHTAGHCGLLLPLLMAVAVGTVNHDASRSPLKYIIVKSIIFNQKTLQNKRFFIKKADGIFRRLFNYSYFSLLYKFIE